MSSGAKTREVRVALCAPGELWGGVEQWVDTFSRQLMSRGMFVQVLALYDGPLRARLEKDGIPVEVVGSATPLDPSPITRIRRLLKDGRVNVIHTHGYKATVLGAIAARLACATHVRTEHGRVEPWTGITRVRMAGYAALESLASRWLTDAVVYVSQDIRRQSSGSRYNRREEVIYNGVMPIETSGTPAALLPGGSDAFAVGIVGRLATVKGHRYLLEARDRLRHISNLHVHVFGSGPLEAECREFCREGLLKDTVHFHGFKPDIHTYLRQLHALAMPSLHEGLPYTLLEAMSQGVPIVASRVGGLAEVLTDGANALLVPSADPSALAAAIERLYNDAALRRTLATNGRRLVCERFLASTMTDRYLDVYRDVLQRVNA